MSTDKIRGVPVRDWQGGTFDPSNLRFFSILPDCDADEAYCVRHERDMPAPSVVLHHDGALYATADGWDVYSCPDCYREIGPKAQAVFRRHLVWAFTTYDDPAADALEGAFKYVGEAADTDADPGGERR